MPLIPLNFWVRISRFGIFLPDYATQKEGYSFDRYLHTYRCFLCSLITSGLLIIIGQMWFRYKCLDCPLAMPVTLHEIEHGALQRT